MGWKTRGEAGQTATEYLGIITVVALVAALLVAVGPARPIAVDLKGAVCKVLLGVCGGSGDGGGADDANAPGAQPGSGAKGDEDSGCHGFLGCTWSGVKQGASQVGSGVYNIGKGAVDDVTGLVHVVTHPGSLIDAGKYIVAHPLDAAKQLVWDDESQKMWDDGDYGGSVGRTIWNVGSWFIPYYDIGKAGSKLGKLGELGRLGEAAGDLAKVTRLADEAAGALTDAEKLAAKGDFAGAEKAAREAEAKAAQAQKEARANGCPIAAGLPGAAPYSGTVLAAGRPALGGGSGGGRGAMAGAVFFAGSPCDGSREVAKNAAKAKQLATDLATAQAANPLIESLRESGQLPSNFVTKADAAAAGWQPGKALENYVPGGQLGGDVFVDPAAIGLPAAAGRTWYEADVGLTGTMSRAKQPGTRLLYSSDGLAYVTSDHYNSVYQLPRWKG